jgi:hypothetical protein
MAHNNLSKGELMAKANPVHGAEKPAVEEQAQEPQQPEAKKPEVAVKPKRGVPYKLPSGTICVDN